MKGFTVIELLLIISIIGIITAVSAPFLSRSLLQANLDTTSRMLVSSIRKAQGYAMDGKNNLAWGVCITSGKIRVFESSCGSPTISDDFTIPSNVSVIGLPTITFSGRGEPSSTVSATVTSDIGSHTIQINSAGGVTIN